jgi:hypothetical protein
MALKEDGESYVSHLGRDFAKIPGSRTLRMVREVARIEFQFWGSNRVPSWRGRSQQSSVFAKTPWKPQPVDNPTDCVRGNPRENARRDWASRRRCDSGAWRCSSCPSLPLRRRKDKFCRAMCQRQWRSLTCSRWPAAEFRHEPAAGRGSGGFLPNLCPFARNRAATTFSQASSFAGGR